jgi:hypothetical protein
MTGAGDRNRGNGQSGSTMFPSVEWFEALRAAMQAHRAKYEKLGYVEVTLIPSVAFADGHVERYALVFDLYECSSVRRIESLAEISGPRVIIEGDHATWREMVENIREHGGADLQHTLNYLTLPDWPMRLSSDSDQGQLDVDRFYRYQESLQEFFNEAASVPTEFTT